VPLAKSQSLKAKAFKRIKDPRDPVLFYIFSFSFCLSFRLTLWLEGFLSENESLPVGRRGRALSAEKRGKIMKVPFLDPGRRASRPKRVSELFRSLLTPGRIKNLPYPFTSVRGGGGAYLALFI